MTQPLSAPVRSPSVQYVTTDDGYRIAYSVSGEGDPFVFTPCLVQNDIICHEDGKADFICALATRFQLIRYDGRGTGNSTRGLDSNMTIEDTARDLKAVIKELRLDRFILFGDVFNTYPIFLIASLLGDAVRAIVLVTPQDYEGGPLMPEWEEMYTHSWEHFTNSFVSSFGPPGQTGSEMRAVVDHEDFLCLAGSARGYYLKDLLPRVNTPTLVLCHRHTTVPSTLPTARKITAALPMAELVLLDGHRISDILSSQNGDLPLALPVIEDFLTRLPNPEPPEQAGSNWAAPVRLSAREQEVLRLVAVGRSNQQIADELVISLSTVAKHVTSILSKTESANRTRAAAYARDHGIA